MAANIMISFSQGTGGGNAHHTESSAHRWWIGRHMRQFGNEPARSLISINTILPGLLSSFQKVKVVSLGGSQSSPRTLLGEGFPLYIEATWEIISSVAKPFLIFLIFHT